MTEKPYGNFTLEQLKQFNYSVNDCKNIELELYKVIRDAEPEKRKSILGDNFSWFHFYEMTFCEHLGLAVLMANWQDEIKEAAKTDDPQKTFFDFYKNLNHDEEWNGGFQGMFDRKHLAALLISTIKTIKSLMVYQKSLSTLVEEVRQGDDKALFDAVRIDRTIVSCPSISYRISMAELMDDKKFFIRLKSAMKGPSRKHMVALDKLRYMMLALVDAGADSLNAENLEQVFVNHLKLYPNTPGAQKNLYKHYTATKKIHHRK